MVPRRRQGCIRKVNSVSAGQKLIEPALSVVLSTFRRTDILAKTLETFCGLQAGIDCTWELIVVDNADDKATSKLVNSFVNRLPVRLLNERKRGKNNALNTALKCVRGELIVFTDDDVLADPGWLQALWRASQRWPDRDIFAGRILPRFPSEAPSLDLKNPWLTAAFVVADWEIPEGPVSPGKVYGPNMAVRRRLFQGGARFNTEIGPSGTDYPMGSEAEFVQRMAELGSECVYVPDALVWHVIRPEQLSHKWLAGRAYRYGRGEALISGFPIGPRVFGVPRHLYRELARRFFRLWKARLLGTGEEAFNAMNDYWFLKGRIHQYRRSALAEDSGEG